MYSKLAFVGKRPFRRFNVIFWTLLLLVVISTFYFIKPTFYQHQSCLPSSIDLMTRTNKAPADVLLREEKALEELASLLAEKEIRQKVNAKLENMKIYEEMIQQKNEIFSVPKLKGAKEMLETNTAAALDRELLDSGGKVTDWWDTDPYPGVENYTKYTVARLGLLPLVGIEPLKPEYGPVINNVTSFHYPIAIPACQTYNSANQSVFIAVISAPGHFGKRNAIRKTWRTHFSVDYHHQSSSMVIAGFAFILGKPMNQTVTQTQIEEESKTYGDIIQIEMADFYFNLSLKVAGLFNWLHSHCQQIDFLFKVDDDVYVNLRNLAQFVQSHNRSDLSIFGKSAPNLYPARRGRWKLTMEEWPWKNLPRYFYGPAVIFPGNTILPFVAAFQTTPLHPIDDLYYSGICAEKAGVKVRGSTRLTSVLAIKQPAVPVACDLPLYISWLTVNATHMQNSHLAADDFYQNRTRCVVSELNGSNTIIDYLAPIDFEFN